MKTFLLKCRLKIFSEESVPLFGPPLPSPPVFTDHQEFRDFLLVKRKGEKITKEDYQCVVLAWVPLPSHVSFLPVLCLTVINGEKATLETPTFAQKRQRTLDMLIRSLYQDLMPDLHKVPAPTYPRPPTPNPRSFSLQTSCVLPHCHPAAAKVSSCCYSAVFLAAALLRTAAPQPLDTAAMLTF